MSNEWVSEKYGSMWMVDNHVFLSLAKFLVSWPNVLISVLSIKLYPARQTSFSSTHALNRKAYLKTALTARKQSLRLLMPFCMLKAHSIYCI